MAFTEFQPPSDFVPESSGGGGSKIWKILGVGCLVLLVIAGIALAFGTWKTVSCCNEMGDMLGRSSKAGPFVVTIAQELKAENFEAMRSHMNSDLAGRLSVDELEKKRKEFARFIDASEPRLTGMRAPRGSESQMPGADDEDESRSIWELSVEFSRPTDLQKLVLVFTVVDMTPKQAEEPVFEVTKLDFQLRVHDLADEPPGIAIVGFHKDLRSGKDEDAFERLDPSFGDIADFEAFLADQEPLFRTGVPQIGFLEYSGRNSARANVILVGRHGDSMIVDYELRASDEKMSAYYIVSIEPTYTDDGKPEDVEDKGDDEDNEHNKDVRIED